MKRLKRRRPALRPSLLPALLAIAAAAVIFGCADDLTPTLGTLRVEIASSSPGAADEVDLFLDGDAVGGSVEDGVLLLRLEPGDYIVSAVSRDTCVVVDPPQVAITVEVGRSSESRMEVVVSSGVSVTSNVDGLPILLDGAETGRVTPATLSCIPPGDHRIDLELNCFDLQEPVGADVTVFADSSVAVDIQAPNLEIASNANFLDVVVDGVETGYETPAILCMSPGLHTVSLEINGDVLASQDVEMGTAPQTIRVDVPVTRPAVLEVMGWVVCANCPRADEFTEMLVHDPEFAGRVYRLEVHFDMTPGGPPHPVVDIFGNPDTQRRVDTYPTSFGEQAPVMVFNGTDEKIGAERDEPLFDILAEKARAQLEDSGTPWLVFLKNLEEVQGYDPGARGDEIYKVEACVSVVAPLDGTIPVLYGFAFKTGIDHVNRIEPSQTRFYDVVRTVVGPIPLNEARYDLNEVGDGARIELEFHYPANAEEPFEAFSEGPDFDGYGIVAIVQTAGEAYPGNRIHNAARLEWDLK